MENHVIASSPLIFSVLNESEWVDHHLPEVLAVNKKSYLKPGLKYRVEGLDRFGSYRMMLKVWQTSQCVYKYSKEHNTYVRDKDHSDYVLVPQCALPPGVNEENSWITNTEFHEVDFSKIPISKEGGEGQIFVRPLRKFQATLVVEDEFGTLFEFSHPALQFVGTSKPKFRKGVPQVVPEKEKDEQVEDVQAPQEEEIRDEVVEAVVVLEDREVRQKRGAQDLEAQGPPAKRPAPEREFVEAEVQRYEDYVQVADEVQYFAPPYHGYDDFEYAPLVEVHAPVVEISPQYAPVNEAPQRPLRPEVIAWLDSLIDQTRNEYASEAYIDQFLPAPHAHIPLAQFESDPAQMYSDDLALRDPTPAPIQHSDVSAAVDDHCDLASPTFLPSSSPRRRSSRRDVIFQESEDEDDFEWDYEKELLREFRIRSPVKPNIFEFNPYIDPTYNSNFHD